MEVIVSFLINFSNGAIITEVHEWRNVNRRYAYYLLEIGI